MSYPLKSKNSSVFVSMAHRAEPLDNVSDESREILLSNVPNRGLGYYDKNNQLVMVSDVNLQLIGT